MMEAILNLRGIIEGEHSRIAGKFRSIADIEFNGTRPWDIKVYNDKIYGRLQAEGSIGLGESYMDGWWDVDELDTFFYKILSTNLRKTFNSIADYLFLLKGTLLNLQSKIGSLKVVKIHYDLPTNLYKSFLDPYMQYSCAYFNDTDDLNLAQEKKLDLICRKLHLQSSDRVLDIGCGWGGFAKYAAEKYGCHVTGVTISSEQAKYAKKKVKGLPVRIQIKDYRQLNGKFDKILVCAMIEHVGHKNYRKLMEIVNKNLKDDGLFLLHTIGTNQIALALDPWTLKYIFPNSEIPMMKYLVQATEDVFVMEDWQNFGAHYDTTLLKWFKNFDSAWPDLRKENPKLYTDRFYRMFKYYLLHSAGSFRSRDNNLWQIVFSKTGVRGGYKFER